MSYKIYTFYDHTLEANNQRLLGYFRIFNLNFFKSKFSDILLIFNKSCAPVYIKTDVHKTTALVLTTFKHISYSELPIYK